MGGLAVWASMYIAFNDTTIDLLFGVGLPRPRSATAVPGPRRERRSPRGVHIDVRGGGTWCAGLGTTTGTTGGTTAGTTGGTTTGTTGGTTPAPLVAPSVRVIWSGPQARLGGGSAPGPGRAGPGRELSAHTHGSAASTEASARNRATGRGRIGECPLTSSTSMKPRSAWKPTRPGSASTTTPVQPAATCTWSATANAYAAGRRPSLRALEGLVDGEAREPEHGQGTVRQPSSGPDRECRRGRSARRRRSRTPPPVTRPERRRWCRRRGGPGSGRRTGPEGDIVVCHSPPLRALAFTVRNGYGPRSRDAVVA